MDIVDKTDIFKGPLTLIHSEHHVKKIKEILKKLQVESKLSDGFYSEVHAKMEKNQNWIKNNLDGIDKWLDKQLQIMTNSAEKDKSN